LLVAGRGSESFDSPANGIVGLGKLEELATFYASIDAVVIPRSGETTGVSVKLLEALAHGVPAIVPSLLAHDAGVADGVIVADEPSEVATAALELLRGDGSAGTPQARSPRMSVDGFAQELLSLKRPSEEEGHEH
jgi:glycosyltransferase involved in cell wall biosynthesis